MNGLLQNRISPFTSKTNVDFNDAKVKSEDKAQDSTSADKTSFKDLIMNSNTDMFMARQAQKNGSDLAGAKSDAEFAQMMNAKLNQQNLRKPQNELDKESFLKLFVTQLQNQDPLNPDDSSEMASQLAQFHGLEQMMNVNKNLEKMQESEGTSRAVSLINFVGKDIKLDNGKVRLDNGKISQALFHLDAEAANTTMEVRDAAGVLVYSGDLGIQGAGDHLVEWNGIDKDGKKAQAGAYTINVLAKDISGNDLPANITTTVRVTGIDLKDAGGSFYTDMGKVGINEISSVGELGALARVPEKAKASGKKSDDKKSDDKAEPAAQATSAAGDQAPQGEAPKTEAPAEPVKTVEQQATPETAVPEQAATPAGVQASAAPANAKATEIDAEQILNNRNMITSPGMPPMMEIPVPGGNGTS